MSTQQLKIGVIAAFAFMVLSNFLSTATKVMNNTDNAQISRENPTTLSPDGATFAIWGLIYLFEAILVVYQCFDTDTNAKVLGGKTRHWIIASFLTNAIWLPIFSYHRWFLSLAVIVGYLYSLYQTNLAMKINYGNKNVAASAQTMAMVGISLNMAWVVVATLLNFTIVSRNSGIIVTTVTTGVTNTTAGTVAPLFTTAIVGGNVDWAILCIVIASALAMYRAWVYCDVPYSFVTAWALGGIYRMQTYATDENFPTAAKSTDQATWALMFSLIVGAVGVVGLGKAIYRGFTTSVDDKDDASLTRSLSSSEKPASYV